jgi:hypothetical protein
MDMSKSEDYRLKILKYDSLQSQLEAKTAECEGYKAALEDIARRSPMITGFVEVRDIAQQALQDRK